MKLKTLKDLGCCCMTYNKKEKCRYPEQKIKKESIKWVKFWYKEKAEHQCPRTLSCQSCLKLDGKIEATIELNNITLEDLK